MSVDLESEVRLTISPPHYVVHLQLEGEDIPFMENYVCPAIPQPGDRLEMDTDRTLEKRVMLVKHRTFSLSGTILVVTVIPYPAHAPREADQDDEETPEDFK